MNDSLLLNITDMSRVAEARRESLQLASGIGMSQLAAGKLGIVITEVTTNLVKHAVNGRILLRTIGSGTDAGVEVLALDCGPGIRDMDKCLRDGYSTAGSPGNGLGAIVRLSTAFDIYSQPGKGTVLLAQVSGGRSKPVSKLSLGAICVSRDPGVPCGDAWVVWNGDGRSQVLLADGLGHGPLAAQAAGQALRTFLEGAGHSPSDAVKALHGPLRSTRGASLAIAEIYFSSRLNYCGVGNISGMLLEAGKTRSMISHNGTVGHELHKVAEFKYPWSATTTLLMHSDGLTNRWRLEDYPGLLARHPSVMAAVLYRDFQRGKDDVTIIVARENHT